MAKIKHIEYIDEETGKKFHHDQYLYWCEGCGFEHAFALKSEGGHHEFNGDLNVPTLTPSLLHDCEKRCHSYIKAGVIQYLSDCWHHLKGQTIQLPDIDDKLKEREEKLKQ
jgi:hypothetical protein